MIREPPFLEGPKTPWIWAEAPWEGLAVGSVFSLGKESAGFQECCGTQKAGCSGTDIFLKSINQRGLENTTPALAPPL